MQVSCSYSYFSVLLYAKLLFKKNYYKTFSFNHNDSEHVGNCLVRLIL